MRTACPPGLATKPGVFSARWASLPLLIAALTAPVAHAADRDPPAPPAAQADRPLDPGQQAPTIGGPSGLVRVVSAETGATHTFRLGLHTELLHRSSFLVSGDRHDRLIGTLALAYTPWRFLELFANLRSQANHNERASDAKRRDPAVILALGDLTLGGKAQLALRRYLSVGGQLELNLLNSLGGVFYKGAATGFYLGTLTSLRLDALRRWLPARLHLNLGFRLDRSAALRDYPVGYDLASLQVERFALGINRNRLQLKLGAEGLLARWTGLDLRPLLEWALDLGTGSADAAFAGRVPADDFAGRVASWFTVGARLRPVRGLNLTLASDLGLSSPGFGYGPPVPVWNLIGGISFAYDPLLPVRLVRDPSPAACGTTGLSAAARSEVSFGRIRGRIVHADSQRPIEGVVVSFPGRELTNLSTGADGSFLSPPLPTGTARLLFRHPDYVATQTRVTVELGRAAKLHVMLQPAPPAKVAVSARVTDAGGRPLVARVLIEGAETPRTLSSDADGVFATDLAPGAYALTVTAPGRAELKQALQVEAHPPQQLVLVLGPAAAAERAPRRADRALVQVTSQAIVLRRKIHFATGKATLRGDALRLLDVVADVLLATPRITQVEIQGHTDSQGSATANLRLSQARAEAVRGHLIDRGVAAERLSARGYGAARPTHPNISAQNREANRRVEFHLK